MKNLSEDTSVDEDVYTIGTVGQIGFGVGAIRDWQLPAGFTKLEGHDNPLSKNYANVLDMTGSHMVCIPKYYYRIEGNNFLISSSLKAGYVLERMFVNAGKEVDYVLVDKFGCGNVGGVFSSKQGIDPCSTSTSHNPIGNLKNAPANAAHAEHVSHEESAEKSAPCIA